MLSVQPKSITPQKIQEILQYLKKLSDAILASADLNQYHHQYMRNLPHMIEALKQTKEYLKFVRAVSHLQHIDVNSFHFDDHDQVSAYLLYLVGEFEQWKTSEGAERNILNRKVFPRWGEAHPEAAGQFREGNPLNIDHIKQCDIGIITVLEHEYQSVIRRLDRIVECTEESSCGFAILDRLFPAEDLKDLTRSLDNELKEMGWTAGIIGSKKVVVVCTGFAGRERAQDCKLAAEALFGIPKIGWLVVGICAGTNDNWPIGTVLVSHNKACSITDPASSKYIFEREFDTISFWNEYPELFSMQYQFRRPPEGLVDDALIAAPKTIPVDLVKFACTRDVVNLKTARTSIEDCLISNKFLNVGEKLGIEMEGPGIAIYGKPNMCIIKGVCDYADERKQNWKKTDAQILFQLYAAETAAELATQMIGKIS